MSAHLRSFFSRILLCSLILPTVALAKGEAPAPEPALSLTAGDGTGLRLVALDARGVLEGPLAFTELRMAFENPRDEVIEGRFQILLPDGAVLSRFAMKIDGEWMEGEVVERQRARQIYEDFLHRRQDPALLEQQAGNLFSARVFPIPARGVKELIVSYSHAMAGSDDPYVIPLHGLPEIDRLDVRVYLGKSPVEVRSNLGGEGSSRRMLELHKSSWTPDRDFEVVQDRIAGAGLRHENLVAVRVAPVVDEGTNAKQPIDGLAVLLDASASRALGFAEQVARLEEVLGALDPATQVVVAAFDHAVTEVFEGRAGDFGADEVEALTAHGALGASDLAGALGWLAARDTELDRVLVVTDGVSTAGDPEPAALADALEALGAAGVARIDALAFGGLRDGATLRRLVSGAADADAGLAPGRILEGSAPIDEIVERMQRPCVSGLEVVVDGADWVWPQTLDSMQAGDEVVIYADVPADVPFRLRVGTRRLDVSDEDLVRTERPLLHRAWVAARMGRLLHLRDTTFADDQDVRSALRAEVTALSLEHRVVSPFTAFLVLETEEDYERYDLDRKALADILIVGAGGLEVVSRKPIPSPTPPEPEIRLPPSPHGERDPCRSCITGTVRDIDEQEPIPGVTLTLRPQSEPAASRPPGRYIQVTDAEGYFRFLGLDPGIYGLEARLDGFSTVEYERIEVREGRETTVQVEMSASIAETIMVTSVSGPSDAQRGSDEDLEELIVQDGVLAMPMAEPPAPAPPARLVPRPEPEVSEVVFGMPDARPAEAEIAAPIAARQVDGTTVDRINVGHPEIAAAEAIVIDEEPGDDEGDDDGDEDDGDDDEDADRGGPPRRSSPYVGRFAEVMEHLDAGRTQRARAEAEAWVREEPGEILALVALGTTCEATGDLRRAARAYASLIDLFPSRADTRRYAGERLDRLAAGGYAPARDLAIDTYRRALEQRPDHPSSHRQLAWALAADGRWQESFEVLESVLGQEIRRDRFAGVERMLREDLGLLAAAWLASNDPPERVELRERLRARGALLAEKPSRRFALTWETDANDVDLHVWDAEGSHAYYGQRTLASGGALYEDITTGYGPEVFVIEGPPKGSPYRLQVHYYNRGPMGFGLGTLQVVDHDGEGGLRVESRPFVIMVDDGWVDLGEVPGV